MTAPRIGLVLSRDVRPAACGGYARWVVLDDDYPLRVRLRDAAPAGVKVLALGGEFDRLYDALHAPIARALATVGRGLRPEVWWSGQVASRSSTATHVVRNILYARFAKDVVSAGGEERVLFICADAGLRRCLARMLRECRVRFRHETSSPVRAWRRGAGAWGMAMRAAFSIREFLRTARLRDVLPLPQDLGKPVPRAILRTWIPEGAFDAAGRYHDRNFGPLPEYLRRQGWDVLYVPMFVDLRRPLADWYRLMAASGERFLVPAQLVRLRSLLWLLSLEARRVLAGTGPVRVDRLDVSDILRHETVLHAFDPAMVRLNLIHPLLGELSTRGIRLAAMMYPFENNAPERMFLLAKRAFYPSSRMVAFQHSVWLSRQAGAELVPDEAAVQPLPDRIVCGGRVYVDILAGLGFPREKLAAGAGLRFAPIRDYPDRRTAGPAGRPPVLFLALPYDRDLSFELLDRLRAAVGDGAAYRVAVKSHPLLDEAALRAFLDRLAFPAAEIVTGSTKDCLLRADVAVNIGTSVVQMEAMACGVPLVRVVPDNHFFLDPMKWMPYPLAPARTPDDLRDRLREALAMSPETLAALAAEVKRDYFEAATDASLAVFTEGMQPQRVAAGWESVAQPPSAVKS